MVGTPAYLAPELWRGGEPSERSDIYALGVTLHFLLTGATPYEGWTVPQLQAAHHAAEPLTLRLAGGVGVIGRLEILLRRCLARSPEDRIQSARELREALAALLDPAAWTPADAETFWKAAEKERFG